MMTRLNRCFKLYTFPKRTMMEAVRLPVYKSDTVHNNPGTNESSNETVSKTTRPELVPPER